MAYSKTFLIFVSLVFAACSFQTLETGTAKETKIENKEIADSNVVVRESTEKITAEKQAESKQRVSECTPDDGRITTPNGPLAPKFFCQTAKPRPELGPGSPEYKGWHYTFPLDDICYCVAHGLDSTLPPWMMKITPSVFDASRFRLILIGGGKL